MLKKSLFSFILLCFSVFAFSQNADSINFVKATWTKQRIAPKVKLVTFHFNSKNLFQANENISYLEINRKGRAPVFAIGAEPKVLKKTSAFGESANAVAAINGTFFDIKNGGSMDYIKIDGKVLSENRPYPDLKRARHQMAAIVIENGILSIKKWDGTDTWENKLPESSIMLTGPLLAVNSVPEVPDSSAFNKARNPRSCVGVKPNGQVILLTVDGRNENSAGMSMFELADVMRWLGCSSSINLDGGGSTTLWVNGLNDNGVVNYPTDNKKWDHEGSRKVANTILLKKKP